ncbi:putative Response regulator [Vibrio nigripulchritudo MADA3029]|uniref:response regulator n=1 Tax=Vibrio nigripulchritudo TaxID=28173 RepID=UPI0003B22522|nr:response regulator [Vibrio nigripulchritudo]CCN46715.1 putative Response regulator [Vibrio nigripulchritudo MADA3020]CCN51424.1 putative Response regulator [Vibrio nigripulchritudo MADA3021]CCN59223.1 putative Response regulator [Vibrio nigripulchritudo MADA3029]
MIKSSVLQHQVAKGVALDKPTVMVVDDDTIFRRLITSYLESNGYRVMEAEDGLDGLKQLRTEVPDLVICDISMPVLNGIEFVEEVCWEYPSLPMIVVSATEEMSDVARALRFGIKDFLSKPIADMNHLEKAISNTLEDAEDNDSEQRDFASQWFRVDESGDLPEEQELHWHLEHLQSNPNMARDLLEALLPERDTKVGGWKCSYRLLQSSESLPLVFDYAWVMDGHFVFYLVDAASGGSQSVATTLLVRALFNDHLRNNKSDTIDLNHLIEAVEKGIACSEYASSINALFGVVDMTDSSLEVVSAGLESVWSSGGQNIHLLDGIKLGEGNTRHKAHSNLQVHSGGQLTLSKVGSSSFCLDIYQGNAQ